jgi:hypothetical protein
LAVASAAGSGSPLRVVHEADQRDALLCDMTANCTHGLPRTRADKRKAVALLLADAEWSQ